MDKQLQIFDDLLEHIEYYNVDLPVIPIGDLLEELEVKLLTR